MKIYSSYKIVFAAMMIAAGLTACDKPGPAETAGKKIDQATENVSTAISNTADKADKSISKEGKIAGQVVDDSTITAKVKSAMLGESGLKSLNINVTTTKGVVTLQGSVNSQENKDKAISLAKSVEGAMEVKSKLVIVK